MQDAFCWDVFLSHSRRDKPKVRRLAERLKGAGLQVWFEEWAVGPAADPADPYAALEEGLKRSRTLILGMSRAAFGAEWGALERGTVLFRDPESRNRRFAPLLLESCSVPDTIRRFVSLDWRLESDEQFQRLLEFCQPVEAETAQEAWLCEKAAEMTGHTRSLRSVAVTGDGRRALTASTDKTLRLWDLETEACLHVLAKHTGFVNSCAIGPRDQQAVSGSEDGRVCVWDLATGTGRAVWRNPGGSPVRAAAFFERQRIVFGGSEGRIRIYDIAAAKVVQEVFADFAVAAIAVTRRGSGVAVGDEELALFDGCGAVETRVHLGFNAQSVAVNASGTLALVGGSRAELALVSIPDMNVLAYFEGHDGGISSVAFSPDEALAVSSTITERGDGARLWRVATGECLDRLPGAFGAAAFTPDGTRILTGMADKLARPGEANGTRLAVWRLWEDEAPAAAAVVSRPSSTVRYSNAKVVLLGESAVGKTGLMNRVAYDTYQKTESTHGMAVERIDLPVGDEDGIEREVWLWDLAGQDDYRLVHQLFLHETSVALMVVNPQADDPFVHVGDWLKALRTALQDAPHDPARLLLAARVDRGGLKVSEEKVRVFLEKHGFQNYLPTSAKTGENCSDTLCGGPSPLKRLIAGHIPWTQLPFIASDHLLRELKNAVLERAARSDASIVRFSELCQQMEAAFPGESVEADEVRKAVRLLGNQGVILPLDFGDLILLKPAKLNDYAAAVIRAARKHSDEIGCVPESAVLEARIDLEGVERLPRFDEALLLRAMVQTFLDQALCLAEDTTEGRQLVFPSQYRRDRPLTRFPETLVTYTFGGELMTIFTTLVVRLWYTRGFQEKEIWQNAAEFRTLTGAKIGFVQERMGEGTARISVFADADAALDQKAVFLEYVHQHLRRNAVDLVRERRYVCACGKPVRDMEAVLARLEAGRHFIICAYCDARVTLVDVIEERAKSDQVAKKVRELDEMATRQLDNQAREQILIGHMMAICGEANQVYRPTAMFDYGIDGEIEFKGNAGKASGRRVYVQLKSGDSFLRSRKADDEEVFDVKDERHLAYWQDQPCDVYLVIRTSDGAIRWMNLSTYLRERPNKRSRQIVFRGERLDAFTLMRLRDRLIPLGSA
jgi:small GTP-binding protein